jgi:hypothetical protein
MNKTFNAQRSTLRGATRLFCLLTLGLGLWALDCLAQGPLPQIGSLPRGSGGGTGTLGTNNIVAGTNIFVGVTNGTNVVISTSPELWTNDVDGPYPILRPVDQTTRMVEVYQQAPNPFSLNVLFNSTDAARRYSAATYSENLGTNSGPKAIYNGQGQYGVIGETFGDNGAALLPGDGVGMFGLADSGFNAQYGAAGLAYPAYNNQTNVGVAGVAMDNGKTGTTRVGVYAETAGATPGTVVAPNLTSSVFLGDSKDSNLPLLTLSTNNGTVKWQVNAAGNLKQVNGAGAGKVMKSDSAGVGSWESQNFGVGPGTATRLAMFDSTTTNVTDSSLINSATNEIDFKLTNSSYSTIVSNLFYGANTNATGWRATSISVDPAGYTRFDQLLGSAVDPAVFPRVGMTFNGAWMINGYGSSATGDGGGKSPDLLPIGAHSIGSTASPVTALYTSTLGLNGPDGLTVSSSAATGTKLMLNNANLQLIHNASGAALISGQRDANGIFGAAIGANVIGSGDGGGSGLNWDTFITRGNEAGTWQFSTNNAAVGTPPNAVLEGGKATGADHNGTSLVLAGGRSTGTGTNGYVGIQTASKSASSSSVNSFQPRLRIWAEPVNLTTNSATTVCTFTVPTSLTMAGAKFSATTEIKDATDIASVHEEFAITALNKAGTVTATNSVAVISSALNTGSAGIANTWTVTVSSTTVSIKCNCVTSGINSTTARVYGRLELDSDGVSVVTFQ